jgi:hypothetical protein
MLIMRFHKLIQSKLVWIIFSFIIVVSFVALQVSSDSAPDPNQVRLKEPVARIAGEEVSFLRLDITRRLLSRQSPNAMNPDLLEDLALNPLAMVACAEQVGIRVEPEVARATFYADFPSEEALNLFRSQLRGSMLSETDFIEFLRERLVIDQLRRAMSGAMVVSDFDAERWADLQTAEYVVAYAPVGPEALPEPVKADEEAVKALFAEAPEQFPLPEKRVVSYLVVPSAMYRDQVEAPTEEEAKARYQQNRARFSRTVEVPTEQDGEEATTRREPIPFPEVENQITQELIQERSEALAERAALQMMVRMTPRRGRTPESLSTLADQAGLAVVTTPAFSLRDPLEGVVNSFAFKQEAFRIAGGDFNNVAGPIRVTGGYALMELQEIIAPAEPTLEQVRDRVQQAADQQATREAVNELTAKVMEEIRSAMADGTSFSDAARAQNLNPLTSEPVSMMTLDPRQTPVPLEILDEIVGAQPGTILGPIETRFGRSFVASVVSRTSRPVAREEALPDVRNMLAEQLQFQGTFQRFQETMIEPMIEKL